MKVDGGYIDEHEKLAAQFPNYKYHIYTTREPENIDPSHPGYVGKQYLQDYFQSGKLEQELGAKLDPKRTHVFLCGNPAMIGPPETGSDNTLVYPEPTGMVELLSSLDFVLDQPRQPGNIHFEKYW